jgi:hypothetical protein
MSVFSTVCHVEGCFFELGGPFSIAAHIRIRPSEHYCTPPRASFASRRHQNAAAVSSGCPRPLMLLVSVGLGFKP